MIPFVYLYYTAKSAHICNKAVHTFTEQSKQNKVHLKQVHKLFT